MEGYVSKVIVDRGFGFIHRRDGQPDIFFHVSDIARDGGLIWGDQLQEREVGFRIVDSPKGPRAVDVRAA